MLRSLLLAAALVQGADADDEARAALALAAAQAKLHSVPVTPGSGSGEPAPAIPSSPSYQDLLEQAAREGRPIVVGNGCIPAVPTGYLSFQGDFPGEPVGMIVGVPRRGQVERLGFMLRPEASVLDVRRVVENARREVRAPVAAPFSRPGEAPPAADAESSGRGPWPESLPFPPELERYRPARYTQRIANTDGRDTIVAVPRTLQEPKWLVPGGMVGVSGWRSDLYRYVPGRQPATWRQPLPITNSFGGIQYQAGMARSYPQGSFFADVLSNDGTVFEVRYREKDGGRWHSSIAFKDPGARPRDYLHLRTNQCASCHDQAGTGGYGAGLVPGGDGVLSDPLQGIEQ